LPLDLECTFELASAGKFVTHISLLQCVERGIISLDEPIYQHLPELEKFGIISENSGPDSSIRPFILRPRTKDVTLRHLLLYTSGHGYEGTKLVMQWRASVKNEGETNPLIYQSSIPLLFEPGEGWHYGASIRVSQLLLERLAGTHIEAYTQENVFRPLTMTSTTYSPAEKEHVYMRALRKAKRADDGKLHLVEEPMYGLTTCVSDFHKLMTDLMSSSSKILTKESLDLLFEPQLVAQSPALTALRSDMSDYEYPAGIPRRISDPPVNWSMAGLVVEDTLPLSHIPAGTVTWNGSPNVIWTMNRQKGLGMIFATQLHPVDDEKTVELAMTFFRDAWDCFA
jgi:CubicO group peptidase (beta-lactamase class C family)